MCGGSPSVDNSIQEQMLADSRAAREEEEARKARIRAGTAKIDKTFGQFDDGFFDGYRDNYLGFYEPEVDRQFGDAQKQLTYGLARAGTINSSMAGEKQADLMTALGLQKAGVLSQANDATSKLRGNINTEKSSLVSLLNATGDSDRAANEALARSQQLYQAQPSYNMLGDLFGGVASGVGNYYSGVQNRKIYDTYFGGNSASGGSARVIP